MGNILTTQAKTKRIIRHVVMMGGLSLLISQKVLAAALFNHIVQPYVGTQLSYDNNLLRLPSNFTPDMSGGKTTTSSFSKQIKAGLALKWQISQQELLVDANVNQNWYSTFNELNYTGYNASARWNWQLGHRLKGAISYNNRFILGSYSQINTLVNNLEKDLSYVAKGAYEFFPDWYLHSGFMRTSTRYPSIERQQNNSDENSVEFGLRYATPLDNRLDFHVIIIDGKYPNRDASSPLDNAYMRTNYNLDAQWIYSIKTRIRGQIGYLSQEFKHTSSRNFSAIIVSGDILWQVTRKSSLFLEAWRDIAPTDDLTSTFSLNQGVTLTPTWMWSETPKIEVELPMSYKQQTTIGTTGLTSNGIISTLPQSNFSTIRVNVNYTPIPNVEMTAFMQYENRQSNSALHTYQDQSAGLTMKVSF
jgi:exopolysaccharide biosynthesis operon protein EpsL